MQKRVVLGSLVLLLAGGIFFAFLVSFCFADEVISVTTYYPSPYGVYNELQTNKLAVGDVNNSGGLDDGDQPPADGQLYTARSVIYKPQGSLPAINTREGELVYKSSDKKFYYYDGSAWVAQASGGTAVISLSCGWGTDDEAGPNHGWDGSCTPPSCPSGWTSVATYSEPLAVSCGGAPLCEWGGAGPGFHPVAVGRSVRVCTK